MSKRKIGRRAARLGLLWLLALATLATTACQADFRNPPRLATATARAAATATPTRAPLLLPAPTATPDPTAATPALAGAAAGAPAAPATSAVLNVWVNENSAAHAAVLQSMVEEFSAQTEINVVLRLVAPQLLPQIVETAVLSNTLPDVILHPIEYSIGWAARGILDPAAADAAVDAIGRATFDPDALDLLELNGQTVAVPSDGYQQLLLYRADWFAERGLATPNSYSSMLAAAEALYRPEALVTGFVIPTESNLVTTHKAFEHLAAGNGCRLIDEQGEVRLLDPACRSALDFYFNIVNRYSPPGVQTDTSARNAFLEGRTGMIMASPAILPDLATQGDLAANTGILTRIRGAGPDAFPANFGNVTTLGITTRADRETAVAFARYWFETGYARWLAVETERKTPLRWGTAAQPRLFIDAWGTQPLSGPNQSLEALYGPEIVAMLRADVAASNRWGLREDQGALVTLLYENLTFAVVLQEMLSGYFNSSKTIFEAYVRVINLIPDYEFPVAPTPGP